MQHSPEISALSPETPEAVDVVIPAGGRIDGDFAREAGTPIKALIAWDGRSILERTVEALRQSGRVRQIVVVGPQQVRANPGGADEVLEEGSSGPENIFRGLEWLGKNGGARRSLIVTGDLPFLTPQVVADFVDACDSTSQVCLGALKREEFEAKYPGLSGEYVRLCDGEWTMGCAFMVERELLLQRRSHIEAVFEARKSQWAMARLLGGPFIARWIGRRLSTAHILARCESVLRCRGQLIPGCAPELAFDVDGPEELRYLLRLSAHPARASASDGTQETPSA